MSSEQNEKASVLQPTLHTPERIRTSDLWFRRAKSKTAGTNPNRQKAITTRVFAFAFLLVLVAFRGSSSTIPAQFGHSFLARGLTPHPGQQNLPRSEERRVGKECRSRWSPYH